MCGVIGIFGHPEAANLAYLGLHALQHRGQESAGIVASDGDNLRPIREMGHVREIFTADRLARLAGPAAIGHVRYSTAGDSNLKNAQPIAVSYADGPLAVAHNGNLVNFTELRARLEDEGSIFQTTSDTEVILHLIARSRQKSLPDQLADALREVRGAFSLALLSPTMLIAVRDPMGIRPLSLGRVRDAWVVASETCAFDLIEAEFVRDIDPGEMLIIDSNGLRSLRPFGAQSPRRCVFEWVYFSRPDSTIAGTSVYRARENMGRRLAVEHPTTADVVIPVPDSGTAAAIGYARESGIPFGQGLMRSHYAGRTFIEPSQSIRHFGVKLKLSPGARGARRQARGGGRRLHRPRHDVPQDHRHDPLGGGPRDSHAHQLAARHRSLPLRDRHALSRGAHRLVAVGGGDPRLRGGGLAGLPLPGRTPHGRWPEPIARREPRAV